MPNRESCAVAFPSQRNNATSENTTTSGATEIQKIGRKPASIQELRAQLIAQQQRNLSASVHATKPAEVAGKVAMKSESCAVALPTVRNCATSLIDEFIEVDGMSLEDATALAALCPEPRPAADWLAMIAELDQLIASACKRGGLDDAARDRIMAGRKCQPLATIPATLQWFRNEAAARFPDSAPTATTRRTK